MTPEELHKRVDKLNKRVGYEWDAFMQSYGEKWDELSIEAKAKADQIIDLQAERWAKLENEYRTT